MSKKQRENDIQTKERVKRPQRYKVLMSNDDFTPMEFVIAVLEHFFNKTSGQATQIMRTIHDQGSGIAGVYSKDVAETKRDKTIQFARENGYPLMLHTEPE